MPVMRPWATMPKMAALMPNVGERGDAEHHVAHVGDRRERDEPLHVGLGQAAERAVDDADDGEQRRSTGAHSSAASGRIGMAMRMKP